MSSLSSAVPSPLFHHSSLNPLVQLLQPHLVDTLPLYSTLQTPGVPVSVWATFPPTTQAEESLSPAQPWVVLADMGNQLRFFSPAPQEEDERRWAEELVISSFDWYRSNQANGRSEIRIGAIPDVWVPAIERAFSKPFYPCNIHYQSLPSPDVVEEPLSYPAGIYSAPANEEHIAQILSTSDVPHPPSYIQQRLPHTTLFFRPSPPSPPSTTPASPPSPSSTQPPELVGHCITHRDGSIGTVYVSPSVRRLGLGGLLLKERMRAMARVSTSTEVSEGETATEGERRLAYCYVSPGNEKSRALMRSVGMEMTEECVSWAVMKVPEAREE